MHRDDAWICKQTSLYETHIFYLPTHAKLDLYFKGNIRDSSCLCQWCHNSQPDSRSSVCGIYFVLEWSCSLTLPSFNTPLWAVSQMISLAIEFLTHGIKNIFILFQIKNAHTVVWSRLAVIAINFGFSRTCLIQTQINIRLV